MSYFSLVVVLLMSVRVLKESLIAATELDMVGGEYVFLAFEIDVTAGLNRQKIPLKWTTSDFGMYMEYVQIFIHLTNFKEILTYFNSMFHFYTAF